MDPKFLSDVIDDFQDELNEKESSRKIILDILSGRESDRKYDRDVILHYDLSKKYILKCNKIKSNWGLFLMVNSHDEMSGKDKKKEETIIGITSLEPEELQKWMNSEDKNDYTHLKDKIGSLILIFFIKGFDSWKETFELFLFLIKRSRSFSSRVLKCLYLIENEIDLSDPKYVYYSPKYSKNDFFVKKNKTTF